MGLISLRRDKPTCSHYDLLALPSLDQNIYCITFPKFILAVKSGLSRQGFGLKLLAEVCVVIFGEAKQFLEKDSFVFSIWRVGV